MKLSSASSRKNDSLWKSLALVLGMAVILSAPSLLSAQTGMKLASGATLKIEGTSTMHDWHMAMQKVEGAATMNLADGQLTEVSALSLTMLAEDLKSEKNGMDKNAYKALKTDEHKNIKFVLTKVKEIKAEGKGFRVNATGNLTVAGTTKPMDLSALCTLNEDGSVACAGTKAFNMTDYGVDPPSFMFGTINTGDEITLTFDVNFAPKQSNPN